ncbi:uncharacterized protein LOC122399668 [Colletes gigas]|uniref:uncharacterized protein LOC122399668 n=1 Tax=Colletes gigas TaxID=935657 RepID=UPI001C9B46E5|nr:uncharacterized protein LOC122399668 [Colletes gigas]
MDELLEFLRVRHKVLENSQFDRTFDRSDRPQPNKRAIETNRSTFACPTSKLACHIRKEPHYTYQCPKLTKVAVEQRYEVVKQSGLCGNCLRPNHTAKQCIVGTCKQCKAKQHTLLRRETNTNQQTDRANVVSLTTTTPFEVILSTAIVEVLDKNNKPRPCRVLLDSGSQSNFLTESFATKLGLKRDHMEIPVVAINQTISQIHHMVKSRIKSRINTFSTELAFLILPQITEILPSQAIPKQQLQLPANLPLTDPAFCRPSEIDGLLGVEIFYKLLCVGQIAIANNQLTLQKTKLDRFWEIEEGPHKKLLSGEESACEQHYQQHTTRDPSSGQYTVRLPFKENPTSLDDSHSIALRRFYSLEPSLAKNPENRVKYTEFMKEYHLLGHMSKLDSSRGRPTIRDDLYSILLRFRCHSYVLTADIEKMYRQIVVHPQDRKYQRILWRDNPQAPIDTYELNTVTYGTSAAPFLAIQSLQQLAKGESNCLEPQPYCGKIFMSMTC